MPYRIEHTTILDKLEQLRALFALHREESLAQFPEMLVDPDVERYAAIEQAGLLLAMVVFDAHDAIVGYSINFLMEHVNHRGLWYAHNNLIFLHPAHRLGGLGLSLIRATEQRASQLGAKLILWQAREGTPLAQIFTRKKYIEADIVFARRLGEAA